MFNGRIDQSFIEKRLKIAAVHRGLLKQQQAQYNETWNRFVKRFPYKAKRMEKRLVIASAHARLRETARSEFVRVYRIIVDGGHGIVQICGHDE
jgi:hypothetical protein